MVRNEKMAVAIAGEAGSGKTTIAKEVGGLTGWQTFGAGELFREWCAQNGIKEIGAESGTDELHDEIDEMMVEKMRLGRAVVEGRVAGLVAVVNELPGVLKVLLVCGAEERYRRIYERDGDKYESLGEVRRVTEQRERENLAVFSERYRRSYLDPTMYDLVVRTDKVNKTGSVGMVVGKLNS